MCYYSGPCSTTTTLKGCIADFLDLPFDFTTFRLSMVPLLNSYIKLQLLVCINKRPIKSSCQALLRMSNHLPFNFQQYRLVYHWFYGSLILFQQSHRLSMYFVSATPVSRLCHQSVFLTILQHFNPNFS